MRIKRVLNQLFFLCAVFLTPQVAIAQDGSCTHPLFGHPVFAAGDGPREVAVGDLDGDGDSTLPSPTSSATTCRCCRTTATALSPST